MLGIILVVLVVLLLIGAVPVFGYNRKWGYAPSGVLGLVLLVLVVMLLMGYLR